MIHASVVEPDVKGKSMLDSEGSGGRASSAPACPRSIAELVVVTESDYSVLDALVRALMGGHADEPLIAGGHTNSKERKELLGPSTVTELMLKYNDLGKIDFVGASSIKGCNQRYVSLRGVDTPERGWCRVGSRQACEKSPKTFRSRLFFF
jgi:hypothetical protein